MSQAGFLSEKTIILAPLGRDGEIAAAILQAAKFSAEICTDLHELCVRIAGGAGLAVIADEAILGADLRPLTDVLGAQPAWSDFPIILMTKQGGGPERNPAAARLAELLGNVTFIERPFHPTTLVSLVRTAIRSRRRQYQARATLAELGEGEQRLQTALTAGNLGSWLLDVEREVLLASKTCKSHFGRTPDQAFSYQDLWSSIHPEDVERVQAAVAQTVAGERDYTIEYRNIWPDGSVHWVDVRGRAIHDAQDKVIQLVGVSSNISERKFAERDRDRLMHELAQRQAELTKLAGTLEQRVEERTRQLQESEAALRQVQKMEVMGQLTGGVAHDFNNLLMAVMGNLDLLRKHNGDDPRSARLIEGALQGAQRGAALTQRMLAFARQQDLQTNSIDLKTLVIGMSDLLERSLGPQFDLKLVLSDDLPLAEADANQIELAVLNLVVNARDAMPNGGAITVTADLPGTIPDGLAPGTYVRVCVADNGSGMSAQTMNKAIEPFFTTKEVGKGTGLGLSMVHGVAVQHGGLFELSSELGMGTVATIWLPASTKAAPAKVAVPRAASESRRSTILVVDDDLLIAMATVDMLEDLGHTVLEANSGKQALEMFAANPHIDLVITDYAMPGMTGGELAEKLRETNPHVPVLLATGYADLPAGQKSELPRLAKPYRQEDLKAEIARLFALRRAVS